MFLKSYDAFQEFIQNNIENALTAAFVFNLQPFNDDIPNLIIHIHPKSNGKADSSIIELLEKIKNTVKSKKVCVKSYAFDADSAFSQLHESYFSSWFFHDVDKTIFQACAKQKCRIICDPLHVLKRARYRLLKTNEKMMLMSNFDVNNPLVVDPSVIQQIINVPPVVFQDNLLTKMHDSLPLELFSFASFYSLYNNSYIPGVVYFFPWTMLIVGLNSSIEPCTRVEILMTSFFCFVLYLEEFERFPHV